MKTILNILAMTLLSANAFADMSTPYGVFNPIAMFENSVHKKTHLANSAFYNYGNRGYDFVVDNAPALAPTLPTQVARLDR
ncbi:MAG: hypothetical protein HN373_05460 [Candidatus Thioglobus sp.]|jgi:hypothetical protein|uniref:hypothetical protein n=1 Tax=Candidatus Thioglobus sp. TaxID=2026721 RepID=UPI0025BC81D7|nr:hypothetical protein [Candidatus Thioglobus sp.]MBT3277421.1 hypothetical protein [Candidatus Thioglobus sp.]